MRTLIPVFLTLFAGFLTLLTFVPLYYFVPRMKASYSGVGTSIPKRIEILINVSDLVVNYYFVLLPVLFVTFLSVLTLVLPASNENDE